VHLFYFVKRGPYQGPLVITHISPQSALRPQRDIKEDVLVCFWIVALPATRFLYPESIFHDGGAEMPFWSKNQTAFVEMDRLIHQQPGIRPVEIAEQLGVARSTVTRRLPSLEEAGFFYSEDKRGGLWPFERGK